MNTIKLGSDERANPFTVPIEIVTEKVAFLGRTGSGKTYTATKLAEGMLEAGAQIVAIDPVGVWRGLRMGADFKIYIFGGLSGDFPLESTGGALVADIIVDRGISAVLDVSQFGTDTELRRFVTEFANRFFFRKKSSPSAVHIFMEECQEMIPQDKQHGDERMLHAMQRLWKLGRNFGIGGSLISQRPQDVNKKALNMSGTLFVHQMTAPGDRDVISKWVDEKGIDADVGAMLPKIRVGHPHVWSPDFLKVSQSVAISQKKTADISSTPKVGGTARAQSLTPIDADKISRDMAATIERAKENDPASLKSEIAKLKSELAKKPSVSAPAKTETVEIPVFDDAARGLMEEVRDVLQQVRDSTETAANNLALSLDTIVKRTDAFKFRPSQAPVRPAIRPAQATRAVSEGNGSSDLDAAQQKILDTVAMLGVRGIEPTRDSVARWLDLHPSGGRYGTNLAFLRQHQFIDGFSLTTKGQVAARATPTGFDAALQPLDGSQREIMQVLFEASAKFTRETLASALNLHPSGGRYGTNLARLRTMGLIPERGEIYLTGAAVL